jgi:hypothetical protein
MTQEPHILSHTTQKHSGWTTCPAVSVPHAYGSSHENRALSLLVPKAGSLLFDLDFGPIAFPGLMTY